MTTSSRFRGFLPLVEDLSRELGEEERHRRLLNALRILIPCDAAALLRLEGDQLIPLAVDGLSPDTLGRRFTLVEHPRLSLMMASRRPTRFAADCRLPDPYDGLVEGLVGHLEVHDCLGCPVYIDDRPWGLITLDSVEPGSFDQSALDDSGELGDLEAFSLLAAASVKANDRLITLLRRAEAERQLATCFREVTGQAVMAELIGQSAAHKRLQAEIDIVAGSDLSVLIEGETGVGKELVAQSIHACSMRSDKPMISINCAALPEQLVESELFGHVRGAFTGASGERRGKFELADGGSLFLDEVGELPLVIQAKLLRVLQSGQLQRLGSDRDHRVDVRILAATNRDLAEEVRAGRFRADLYHRLSVYPLKVPPLRERGLDVLLLAGHFLEQNRARLHLRGLRLSAEARGALLDHSWPGNVRELEHLLGRAVLKAMARQPERPRILTLDSCDLDLGQVLAATPSISSQMLKDTTAEPVGDLRQMVDAYQRQLIQAALRRYRDNWAAAARALGMDRANLHRLATRLGLK
ncbi:nitric oxide reductase transcriptional regulator NorR [Pseudomonas citronellolis]|uniref:nitric oxide reductase transcriptional regulator NorR n=1 Tax=Pseudomonas citronellolis TaxID=53408 RepID=UPI0021BE6A88|nr:nitric oxide reductase transcriptional regulator NorR [Pseudomonas citronellolis]UXJ50278.1 nitric oxide reductase transcriptional regulator NorR [Pseudomonas citronellolis]